MGTRHLICVMKDETCKVAQYGQWDGYPSGQGVDVLQFLTTQFIRPLFELKLNSVKWITDAEFKARWAECGAIKDDGWVTMDVSDKHKAKYPENDRDTGAGILALIQNADRPLKLVNSLSFAGESLFCEWAYVIDLDKNVFEVYEGFNKNPVPATERFSSLAKDGEEYYPVRLRKTYSLFDLPTKEEFLDAFAEKEKQEVE